MTQPGKKKPWRDFEQLIATIHETACPTFTVKHNDFVTGKSGTRRQLDVVLRGRTGPYNLFLVIECKRERRPVDIEAIESFVTKLNDVSASKGIIIAPAGFTAGARNCAKRHCVDLLSYRKAKSFDWQFLTTMSVIYFRGGDPLSLVLMGEAGEPLTVTADDVFSVENSPATCTFNALARFLFNQVCIPAM